MCCADGSLGSKLVSKLGKKEEKSPAATATTDGEEEVADDAPK